VGAPLFPHEPAKEARQLHPLVLAYAGDAVYELFVRQYLISRSNHRPNHLHRAAVRFVSAEAQAAALRAIAPLLTEEEAEVVKRGRNAKSGAAPRHADVQEYRHSTALECLVGYLYFTGQTGRLNELLQKCLEARERDDREVPERQ
jgi:ribonuclease-3 family protein